MTNEVSRCRGGRGEPETMGVSGVEVLEEEEQANNDDDDDMGKLSRRNGTTTVRRIAFVEM